MRRGFSLIAAIFFIVIIATIAILALSYATLTAKNTRDIYLKEQAKLLAQSATEYAVMVMQATDYKLNCPRILKLTYPEAANPMFNITVNLHYLDRSLTRCSVVGDYDSSLKANDLNHLSYSTRSAIIDVEVVSAPGVSGSPTDKIRYTRRTLQKP